ncbi:uncharacterized protein LOC111023974 isoform X2 [Momordica charantia]|uniref:Uncharacterized protein LOC111023974 isoform X2 n=1 Tax=Momordica charantia TaxID=3673 RepID=A0A6J1DSG8_MOMCH|nr:uncharacterized protein LOC111023974 isoform X2 [Momordica charantia]XP_022157211.1 uncharacterized protein LOC111023974 isoform X2 [Momordica charantia]
MQGASARIDKVVDGRHHLYSSFFWRSNFVGISALLFLSGKCPRQLGSIECGYYLQKYIREIVCNPNTPITELFNTKNAYKQEEIDEVQIEWTSFVGRFV